MIESSLRLLHLRTAACSAPTAGEETYLLTQAAIIATPGRAGWSREAEL